MAYFNVADPLVSAYSSKGTDKEQLTVSCYPCAELIVTDIQKVSVCVEEVEDIKDSVMGRKRSAKMDRTESRALETK